MNNKGFTLVEVIMTLVILSLIMGIAVYGIMGTINNSKNKGEEIFVEKLMTAIDEYVGLKGSSLSADGTSEYEFGKCYESGCYDVESDSYLEGENDEKTYYLVKAKKLESIKVSDLIAEGLLDEDSIVNPSNDKKCFVTKDPEIKFFKDSDYVYYYYVDLRGNNTDCEISGKNAIINTLPESLKKKVQGIL